MAPGDPPEFEFNAAKDEANLAKHGIRLGEAKDLWLDPDLLVLASDFRFEMQYLAIGCWDGRHWTAIFTRRCNRLRLISARRVRDEEREIYEEKKARNRRW